MSEDAGPYFFMELNVFMEIRNGTYCVYIHTNKINGKMYVGQTIHGNRPQKRWDNGNGYIHCPYFFKAIAKYGWDNFEHEIIANNLTADEADNFERLLIAKIDTMNPDRGYNLEPGGIKNKTLSESTKKKISESHMGDKNPMYGVRLIGEKNGMYGKHLSDETKNKISEAISGAKNGNYGKKLSDEHKQKISQSRIGKYAGKNSPMYGKHLSEDTKQKIGDAHRGVNAYNAKAVVQMDDDYNVIQIWGCIADAYRSLNICRQSIPEVLNGEQQHAGGYRWAYLYDQTRKNGVVILGAISLGYIVEEEIENVKSISV